MKDFIKHRSGGLAASHDKIKAIKFDNTNVTHWFVCVSWHLWAADGINTARLRWQQLPSSFRFTEQQEDLISSRLMLDQSADMRQTGRAARCSKAAMFGSNIYIPSLSGRKLLNVTFFRNQLKQLVCYAENLLHARPAPLFFATHFYFPVSSSSWIMYKFRI